MSDILFDADDDGEDYYLVAIEGTIDANGYAEYIDRSNSYRATHMHYKHAQRFEWEEDADRAAAFHLEHYGVPCDIIEITHSN